MSDAKMIWLGSSKDCDECRVVKEIVEELQAENVEFVEVDTPRGKVLWDTMAGADLDLESVPVCVIQHGDGKKLRLCREEEMNEIGVSTSDQVRTG